jgi:NAD(P)-dependent dehydrogenase (short-subunit alcohol dehydrogenase family)
MEISLHGRSAIVTGGSKGLGLAIATQFVTPGANVVIAASGPEALVGCATFFQNWARQNLPILLDSCEHVIEAVASLLHSCRPSSIPRAKSLTSESAPRPRLG